MIGTPAAFIPRIPIGKTTRDRRRVVAALEARSVPKMYFAPNQLEALDWRETALVEVALHIDDFLDAIGKIRQLIRDSDSGRLVITTNRSAETGRRGKFDFDSQEKTRGLKPLW